MIHVGNAGHLVTSKFVALALEMFFHGWGGAGTLKSFSK